MTAIYRHLRSAVGAAYAVPAVAASLDSMLQLELLRDLAHLQENVQRKTPGNPAAHGFKAYSQADEDGILQAIFDRLGLAQGSFLEIGCGTGVENNTHFLLLKGWQGIWVDGDPQNIEFLRKELPESRRLTIIEAMIDRDNVSRLIEKSVQRLSGGLDLLSVDIDGNDLDVTIAAARAWRPRVIIVEYNAKFPPPAVVHVTYDPAHRWNRDDYHGASLCAMVKGLAPDYTLVSCNLAGTNAFFVRADCTGDFSAYKPAQLYQPARFYLTALRSGHSSTLAFLRQLLAAGN
jgi:hypothetical protein